MNHRCCWVLALALLLIPGLVLADSSRTLSVDDVLRLHYAGVSEEIILSEIIVTETVFELTVDEILRLQEAGLSERLLKFMVDTAQGTTDSEEYSSESYEDETYGEEEDGEVWANLIEEDPEPTTTYYVSLNYSYGSWWYDSFWWDYWYYDYHYYPYQSAWVFQFGVWYPTWYSYRHCWSPAYFGYRRYCWSRYAWGGPYYDQFPTYYYTGAYRHHGHFVHSPSRVKYKSGQGSSGKPLFADLGLKARDGSRLPVKTGRLDAGRRGGKTRDGKLVLADPRHVGGKHPIRRPVKSGRSPDLQGGPKDPRGPSAGKSVEERPPARRRAPSRGVRSPASGGRPVKVRRPHGSAGDRHVKHPPAHRPHGKPPAAKPKAGATGNGTKKGVTPDKKVRSPTKAHAPPKKPAPRNPPRLRPKSSRSPAKANPPKSRSREHGRSARSGSRR